MEPTQPQANVTEPVRDGRTVTIEFPCSKCKYDLFGRTVDQDCPECGQPIRSMVPPTGPVYFFSMKGKWSWAMIGYEIGGIMVSMSTAMLVGTLVLWTLLEPATFRLVAFAETIFVIIVPVSATVGALAKWKNFRIVAGPDEIRYSRSKDEVGAIARTDVWRIEEWPGVGIGIRMYPGFRSCEIPRQIDGFEELRGLIAGWKTFKTASIVSYLFTDGLIGSTMLFYPLFMNIAMIGCVESYSRAILAFSLAHLFLSPALQWTGFYLRGNNRPSLLTQYGLITLMGFAFAAIGIYRLMFVLQ